MHISSVSCTNKLLYYYEETILSERPYSILNVNISKIPTSSVLPILVIQQWGTVTPNGPVVPASDYR
jgi:hypothetical protein